jgi:haloalkane dehalogenase
MPDVSVLDSTMHYEETGEGDPTVLLHGNPTSSFLWRKVIPGLVGQGRVLAPDLIGMGRSGKPDIGYRFADHARYLDAWFDALALERVSLVGHDWGGALGFHWARRHPNRVTAMAFMETIVKPIGWDEFPEAARELFQGLRTSGTGEQMVLDQNLFVEAVLPASMLHQLTADEMEAYREPFAEPKHRLPTLVWPRELPIDGEPADVVEMVNAYGRWLASSDDVPKLLLTFEPGAIMSEPVVQWCRTNMAALEVVSAGKGIHFVQEDEPEAIARIIGEWRRRVLAR